MEKLNLKLEIEIVSRYNNSLGKMEDCEIKDDKLQLIEDKINEIIEASNEQEKKIDFIMENTYQTINLQYNALDKAVPINPTLKQIYEDLIIGDGDPLHDVDIVTVKTKK